MTDEGAAVVGQRGGGWQVGHVIRGGQEGHVIVGQLVGGGHVVVGAHAGHVGGSGSVENETFISMILAAIIRNTLKGDTQYTNWEKHTTWA